MITLKIWLAIETFFLFVLGISGFTGYLVMSPEAGYFLFILLGIFHLLEIMTRYDK
jgi:hypothetical protein